MLEERSDQSLVLAYFGKLGAHAFFQLFSLLQRPTRISDTLGMAPHQLVWIQFRRIARQEMQSQSTVLACDIVPHHQGLVRRQSIKYQVQRFLAVLHQRYRAAKARSLLGRAGRRAAKASVRSGPVAPASRRWKPDSA